MGLDVWWKSKLQLQLASSHFSHQSKDLMLRYKKAYPIKI